MKNSHFGVEELLTNYSDFSNKDIDENKKYIRDLSTGTKVRIGVLSLLAGDPKYMIMDEPFAHEPNLNGPVPTGFDLFPSADSGATITASPHPIL